MRLALNCLVTPSSAHEHDKLTAAGIYEDGILIKGAVPQRAPWRSIAPEKAADSAGETIGEGAYLGWFFAHFGHFLTETLPGFYWANQFGCPLILHPLEPGGRDWLRKRAYIGYCVETMNIDPDRLVFADRPLKAERLWLPPLSNVVNGHAEPETLAIYDRLSARAVQEVGGQFPERVYLSRRKFEARVLVADEEAIEREFEQHGFAVIFPETLPFHEQIALAARAKIVAGLSGSALHLSGFMQPGAKLMILGRQILSLLTINEARAVETVALRGAETEHYQKGRTEHVEVSKLRAHLDELLTPSWARARRAMESGATITAGRLRCS